MGIFPLTEYLEARSSKFKSSTVKDGAGAKAELVVGIFLSFVIFNIYATT